MQTEKKKKKKKNLGSSKIRSEIRAIRENTRLIARCPFQSLLTYNYAI